MKRVMVMLGGVLLLSACTNNEKITISEQQAANAAYDLSYDLATKVIEAESYEEFRAARENLEAHRDAFRRDIGGENYLIFIEECNVILNEI